MPRISTHAKPEKGPIGSLQTFLQLIYSFKTKPGYTRFYRGQPSFKFELRPSIYRNDNISKESQLFRDLVSRCPEEFEKCRSTFEHLVKMQHYGLPTRLLDITTNPLVALYFACQKDDRSPEINTEDATVYIFDIPNEFIHYYDGDSVSILSNLSKLEQIPDISPYNIENEDDQHKFNHEEAGQLLHEIKSEKPYFKDIIKLKTLKSVICVKPKLNNPRIIRQSGAFLLFGYNGIGNSLIKINSDWYEEINIAGKNKSGGGKDKILQELTILNISHDTLFPDIENVSKTIKNNI